MDGAVCFLSLHTYIVVVLAQNCYIVLTVATLYGKDTKTYLAIF